MTPTCLACGCERGYRGYVGGELCDCACHAGIADSFERTQAIALAKLPDTLYHFTCQHAATILGIVGWLKPHAPVWLARCPLVWLTQERSPERDDCGLTPRVISCDRMLYRYLVRTRDDPTAYMQWLDHPARAQVKPSIRRDLERYAKPETWWVSSSPIKVTRDLAYSPAVLTR